MKNNKSLGQHWLKDRLMLEAIAGSMPLGPTDVVVEIGPGLGTLTSVLLRHAGRVIAIEYDSQLAAKLPAQFPGKNLQVIPGDFLTFDLGTVPEGYKVVANVPYYITQKIIEHILVSRNQPADMALLVQQEVAEKLAGQPGTMTAIAAKLQFFYDVHIGTRVPKEYFTPPPEVESQVVICKKHHVDKYAEIEYRVFTRVVDAGFSAPRKKLRSSLAGGLAMEKTDVENILHASRVSPDSRAEDVGVDGWARIAAEVVAYGHF